MTLLAALAMASPQAAPIQITPGKQAPGLRPIAFAAAPTGSQFVASMEDGSVRIIDAKTGQTVRNLNKHPQPAYAVDWSKDGRFIATGDETARVWLENALTGEKMREFRTHTRGIQRLSFNIAHTLLITTGRDDAIHVLDLQSNKPKEARSILGAGANFYGATFNPRSLNEFTTATLTIGGAREYDATSGTSSGLLTGHDAQGAMAVAYNPAATRIASGGKDGGVSLYDGSTLKKINTFKGHGDWVMDLAFSPNGRLLATSSTDQTVKVWDIKAMQKVADIPKQSFVGSPLCFTGDGTTLITVSDQGYLQYNKVTPVQPAELPPVKKPVKPAVKPPVKKKKKG
jgi:WD40 repeat protein